MSFGRAVVFLVGAEPIDRFGFDQLGPGIRLDIGVALHELKPKIRGQAFARLAFGTLLAEDLIKLSFSVLRVIRLGIATGQPG